MYLQKNGKVIGENATGSWTVQDGSYFMTITIDGVEYSGVFCTMIDEGDAPVMAFSAVGINESVWGVKYLPQTAEE